MFTGIVEKTGVVTNWTRGRSKRSTILGVSAPALAKGLRVGSSLAVNGACLTVISKRRGRLFFHLLEETKKRTNLGDLLVGEYVNLERPLKASGRLEGHFVLGHIDGVGRVRRLKPAGEETSALIGFPSALTPYFLEKGSIAANGVSLTIGKVLRGAFWVHLIPHTLSGTNLGALAVGKKVNLETDILMKLALRQFGGWPKRFWKHGRRLTTRNRKAKL